MRKKIVAGNWKMNTTLKDGMELAKAVEELEKEKTSDALVIIAPPYTHLSKIKELRTQREKLAHPKEVEDVIEPDLQKIKCAFSEYNNFLLTIMSNFFISINIPQDKISDFFSKDDL